MSLGRGASESHPSEEALRRSEAGLRLALEAGEMGSWEWDIKTGEIRWSDNLEAIHGLARGAFGCTFEAYKALIHPDDRDWVLQAIHRSVESGADYEAEFRSADTAQGARWMLARGKVLTDERGAPNRMIGVCMDVTKRKGAEEVILEANRRKDEFLAMVSHELRNPLAAIMNASAVLDHVSAIDPISMRATGVIRRQTERLVRIVDDLLDVSRLNAGKLTLAREPLDLAAVVERCVQDVASRRLLENHRHELRARVTTVNADGPRLEQIVSNLLTNAIKYTPTGGTIVIDVAPEGAEAVLRVKDTGIGISAELLPRVFDLFVQSDRGLARQDGGLGLGLAIVRSLVEAHGGRVEARSPGPNAGTELIVRLPLAATPDSDGDPVRRPVEASARRRVLIIDDNEDARDALVGLLRMAGHEVHQAGDGPSGIDLASRVDPEVVIVDIGLPGLDGFEVARRLGARTPKPPRLIALTGYGQPRSRHRATEVGFEAYLVKPIAIETLLQALQPPPKP